MRRRLLHGLLAPIALAPLLGGCMSGIIYSHTWNPVDTNFGRTPVFSDKADTASDDIHHIHVPLTSINLDVAWKSNAIGDIAKRNGIEEVCYADIENFSVLTIWNEYTVHIYGRPFPKPPDPPAAPPTGQ